MTSIYAIPLVSLTTRTVRECTWAGKVSSPTQVGEGQWGSLFGRPVFRPPGTRIALPLSPQHRLTITSGKPTVEPSIDYDPGGVYAWHGWLRDGVWDGPERTVADGWAVLDTRPEFGTLPVYAATEQCRHPRWAEWEDYNSYRHAGGAVDGALGRTMECLTSHERRQVIEWCRPEHIDVMEVVDYETTAAEAPSPCIVVGAGVVFLREGDKVTLLTAEPWAQSLQVGQFVVRLTGLQPVTPPITEHRADGFANGQYVGWVDVPLSVPAGAVTRIEVPT